MSTDANKVIKFLFCFAGGIGLMFTGGLFIYPLALLSHQVVADTLKGIFNPKAYLISITASFILGFVIYIVLSLTKQPNTQNKFVLGLAKFVNTFITMSISIILGILLTLLLLLIAEGGSPRGPGFEVFTALGLFFPFLSIIIYKYIKS